MKLLLLSLFFFVSTISFSQELKQSFIVTIDGKEQMFSDGQEFKIPASDKEQTVSITASNTNLFDCEYVTFNIPSSFAYKYDLDEGFEDFSFDGSDFVVSYMVIDEVGTIDDYVGGIVEQLGAEDAKIENLETEMGGHKLNGKRVSVSMLGSILTMDSYIVDKGDGKTHILLFQDIVDEEEGIEVSDEAQKTKKLVKETIKFK